MFATNQGKKVTHLMYEWIQAQYQEDSSLPISRLCSVLGVSRSGYYDWLYRKDKSPSIEEITVRDQIQRIVLKFPGYGYPRVTRELRRRGYVVNHKRVLRLMREDNLLCLRNRRFFKTTDSAHNFPVYPNLAKQMHLTDINQLWVADITYIRLPREFLYLAVIMDVFSRKCIGWQLDDQLNTSLTLTALQRALKARWHTSLEGLVHPDR